VPRVIGRTFGLGTLIVVGACTGGEMGSDPISRSTACRESALEWGSGPTQVGLVRGGDEVLARGPQAIAVGRSGETFVLDSVNGRVLAAGPSVVDSAAPLAPSHIAVGASRVVVDGLSHDVDALAIGSDGAIAVYSPLRATVSIFDRDGSPAGAVAIDRALHETVGISLGASRQVIVHSALQETMTAGSPSAPTSLPTMLMSKHEGAFLLPDGAGLATHAMTIATSADGGSIATHSTGVELLVTTNPAGRRSTVRSRFAIPVGAQSATSSYAATLVGVAGTTACMRVEQVTQPTDRIEVSRRAVCMDATNGRVLVDMPLATPQPYVPAHELAVGRSSAAPIIATLQPTTDALIVRTCEVSR
jgi:hypothetical protein